MSEIIRTTHNSFARPEPFAFEKQEKDDDKEDEAFHFISYIYKAGTVYELDGLKKGPIALCQCKEEEWLQQAADIIQARMNKYGLF